MYDQSIKFQSGVPSRGGEGGTTTDRPSEGMPHLKLVTDGNGRVWPVNENGKPLGIITKSHPTLDTQGFQRIQDYALQQQAAKLLHGKSRVCFCGKRKIDKNRNRSVVYNPNTERAYFENVQRCGSIWDCKVCAKKITETRRKELAFANELWKSGVVLQTFDYSEYPENFIGPIRPTWEYVKGHTYLITLTNSHNAGHSLLSQREGQKKAMKRFFEGRKAEALMGRLGKRFHITNYEVTFGKNGWHPHHHILVFSDKALSISEFSALRNELAEHWINCCRLSKLPLPNMEHGLDLADGTYADQYIGKWGVEHEMTKGHIKKGKEGGLTPFDLLQLSFEDELVFGRKPSQLFKEYAAAFKGARQLMWSRGLKDVFGLCDVSDDEIMDKVTDEAIKLNDVEDLVFRLLVKYKKYVEFLIAVEEEQKGVAGAVDLLVDGLVRQEIENVEKRIA